MNIVERITEKNLGDICEIVGGILEEGIGQKFRIIVEEIPARCKAWSKQFGRHAYCILPARHEGSHHSKNCYEWPQEGIARHLPKKG